MATRAARDQWMVFEPQKETLFEVAPERLLDRDNCAHLEALHSLRNGAARNVEQIDADRSVGARHQSPRLQGLAAASRSGDSISRAITNGMYSLLLKNTR
jgi:hypothetical protein